MAIMPDVHMGYDMPIGGVALLDNAICPAYVGYDIGCGVICVITDYDTNVNSIKELKQALKGWKLYSIAREERIVRPGDKRVYVWVVAQKPEINPRTINKKNRRVFFLITKSL